MSQLATNIIMLDRTLAHYGAESKDVREMLRASVDDILRRTWPNENPATKGPSVTGTEGQYEGLFEMLQGLTPQNDKQRTLQAQALKTAIDAGQLRRSLFAQKGSSIPFPFSVVMVAWLTLLFASFSLFASPNPTVVITLLICALAVSSAIFLILELDRPFNGVIQIPSTPIRAALDQLGRQARQKQRSQ